MAALVVPHKSFPVSSLPPFLTFFLLSFLSNVIAYKCKLSLLSVFSPLLSSLHAYYLSPGLLYHLDIYISCRFALHCTALHCVFFCRLITSLSAIIIKSWLLHISRSVNQSVTSSVCVLVSRLLVRLSVTKSANTPSVSQSSRLTGITRLHLLL